MKVLTSRSYKEHFNYAIKFTEQLLLTEVKLKYLKTLK